MKNETGYSESELNCKGCMGSCGMCETKLKPADLALYLGAECEVTYSPGGFEYYDDGGIYLISGGLINEYGKGEAAVKPILRPLSDMTETEAREIYRIDTGNFFEASDWMGENPALDYLRESDEVYAENLKILIGNPSAWRYLLSLHFDLLGWIPAGLAIDKTKTTQP
jgi:hypothetical protein